MGQEFENTQQSQFPGSKDYFNDDHGTRVEVYVPQDIGSLLGWLDQNPQAVKTYEGFHVLFQGTNLVLQKNTERSVSPFPFSVDLDSRKKPAKDRTENDISVLRTFETAIQGHEFAKLQKEVTTLKAQMARVMEILQAQGNK